MNHIFSNQNQNAKSETKMPQNLINLFVDCGLWCVEVRLARGEQTVLNFIFSQRKD